MDMRKMSSVCDYFVIASGTSTTQVRAIADNIDRCLKEKRARIWHKEGEREALWILLDAGDVVAHIFQDQTRKFYDLERLWIDAPQERFREAGEKAEPKRKAGAKGKARSKPKAKKTVRRPKVKCQKSRRRKR